MPELPEVETVKNTLLHQILNEKIVKVNVYYDKIIKTNLEEFKALLVGETLTNISRYGKYLIFIFNNVSVLSHLRMEGKFFLKHENDYLEKHEHIEWVFESGRVIRYADTRKFGTMHLLKTTSLSEIMNTNELKVLGEEANTDFDCELLYSKLQKRKDPIKTALLDQSVLAGLGNIYVDEVLFKTYLNPLTPSCNLSYNDCERIKKACNNVLTLAIKEGGSTIRSYTSSLGVTGRFQQYLEVHTLEGTPCKRCGTIIEKIFVGGRGTSYCPNCQKKKPMVYGITGSISSGKSTISSYFKDLGYKVYDADKIVHLLYEQEDFKNKLIDLFGNSIISNNSIDRKKLGDIVFNDPKKLKVLEELVHPAVIHEMRKLIYYCEDAKIFFEVQLLFESKFNLECSKIIYCDANKDIQIKRLMERNNISYEDAVKKIELYDENIEEFKKSLSHYIIDNSHDLCYTFKQLDKIK